MERVENVARKYLYRLSDSEDYGQETRNIKRGDFAMVSSQILHTDFVQVKVHVFMF